MSHSLNNCVNCLPGQKDVDMALKSIGEASKKLLLETVRLQANVELGCCVFCPFFSPEDAFFCPFRSRPRPSPSRRPRAS